MSAKISQITISFGEPVNLPDGFERALNGFIGMVKQIDARLSQPDWIRVEDALPVVPDGAEFVRVWEWEECCSSPWLSEFHPDYFMSASHWRYAETTPTPPSDV